MIQKLLILHAQDWECHLEDLNVIKTLQIKGWVQLDEIKNFSNMSRVGREHVESRI